MTPAIKLLEKAKADHRVVSYDHDPDTASFGTEAVEALGLHPDEVFKTLLATLDGSETVVAVIPVSARLDLKSLARSAGAKKAAMADPAQAERLTGYVVGGISPLGQKRRLRTFVDSSAQDLETMHVSGGRRGLEIALAPAVLTELTGASFVPLTPADRAGAPGHTQPAEETR